MLILSFLGACGDTSSDSAIEKETESERVNLITPFQEQLVGVFDSAEQAQSDTTYYAVRLSTCTVDAPEIGETVLYVEQALVETPMSPYRQRLYKLEQPNENTVQSSIYELSNPDQAAGLCNETGLRSFAEDEVIIKIGCEVVLQWDGEGFFGTTEEGACLSSLNGASYATSEVLTRPDRIESWDRGWFTNGNQAWGAIAGAYIFKRRE